MNEGQILDLLRQFPWEPAWLLAILIALIYGTIFQLIWGRHRRSIFYYWFIALVVMLGAQWLFSRAPLTDWSLGNLRIVEASILCWIALFLANIIKL